MDKDEQIFQELQGLRDEMKSPDILNTQIVAAVIGAVALILTSAFGLVNPVMRLWAFLSVFVVTVPAYSLLRSNWRRTWLIATYLRVFLEPELSRTKWESRLYAALRPAQKPGVFALGGSSITSNVWFIIATLDTIATVAAAYTLSHLKQPTWTKQAGGAALLLWYMWITVLTWLQDQALRRGGPVEEGNARMWQELKDKEQQGVPAVTPRDAAHTPAVPTPTDQTQTKTV